MPTYVAWEPSLSTFVEDMDNRQRELLNRLNDFFIAVVAGNGKENMGDVLDFLVSYCDVHFGTEEFYMQESGYPRYSEHKRDHAEFTADVLDIQRQIKSGTSSYPVITLIDLLGKWVGEHVMKLDKEFASCVKSVQPVIIVPRTKNKCEKGRDIFEDFWYPPPIN